MADAKEVVNATKVKMAAAEALALSKTVDKIIAAKGKNNITLDLKKDKPSDEEVVALLLGPTGNLRAPTIRVGRTLLVGFSEEAYGTVFG